MQQWYGFRNDGDSRMNNVKVGYKVVRIFGDQYLSVANIKGVDAHVYHVGLWETPSNHCGPFAIFDTLENAQHFALSSCVSTFSIFQCEWIPWNTRLTRMPTYENSSVVFVRWLWQKDIVAKPYGGYWPMGMRLAKAIKLIEKYDTHSFRRVGPYTTTSRQTL